MDSKGSRFLHIPTSRLGSAGKTIYRTEAFLYIIRLYLDSIGRFTFKQFCYLIINRYIKKCFSPFIFLSFRSTIIKQNSNNEEAYTGELKKLMTFPESNKAIWEVGLETELNYGPYVLQLNEKMVKYMQTNDSRILLDLWCGTLSDIEIQNNYQRFYLFDISLKNTPEYSHWVITLINNWIDLNPPLHRSNSWESFNCAIRLINWMKLLFYMADDEIKHNRASFERILQSISLQADHIYNNIQYELPGNHPIIQLICLWLIATAFPKMEGSKKWIEYSEKRISSEINMQFKDSSFHCEHSFHYHIQVALFCLFWIYGMQSKRKTIPKLIKEKIFRAFRVIKLFTSSPQYIPLLGDNCFPFFHRCLEEDIENLNTIGKYLFFFAGTYDAPSGDTYPYIVNSLGTSKLIIDVGNIGNASNPGHGHSDIFSFIWYDKGIPIFIDPGTKSYNNDAESMEIKGAKYHNTISIDGSNQAKLWSIFRWAFLPTEVIFSILKNDENQFILEGYYSGFKEIGIVHHRRKFIATKNSFVIEDFLKSDSLHDICLNFILDPSVEVLLQDNAVLLSSNGFNWSVNCSSSLQPIRTTENIFVYKEYQKPMISTRLELKFADVVFPFESKIQITPVCGSRINEDTVAVP